MSVRRATERDVVQMTWLFEVMHSETRFGAFDYDQVTTASFILAVVNDPTQFAHIAEHDGDVYGVLLGYVVTLPFGRDRVAYDTWFYVRPDKRGGLAAKTLVSRFRAWAGEQGARKVAIGVSSGVNDERAGIFLQRIGFERVATCYERDT